MKKRRFRQSLTSVVLISLVTLVLIVQAGTGLIGYYEFENTIQEEYRNNVNMLANAAANTIDVNALDDYLASQGQDEGYIETKKRLQNLTDSSGSYVIYVAKLDEEKKERTYIFNAVRADSGMEAYEIDYSDEASEGFLDGYLSLLEGDASVKNYMYSRTKNALLGPYTTTVAALRDDTGEMVAVCGVVMPMTALSEARTTYMQQMLIWLALIFVVAGGGWFILVRRKVVMPLRQIADEAFRFSNERTVAEVPLAKTVHSHSEIGELALSMDEMERTIVSNVDRLLEMSEEKSRIESELNIATQIQCNVLPHISESFPGRKEIDIYASMQPAKEVGGDFYDFFFIDENHFAIVIADVAGKGIPAALYMMVSKALIKAACIESLSEPGEVLTSVNRRLCENEKIEMFVTVWLGILDLRTGMLTASNAGHEYPVIGRSGQSVELLRDKHGFVLGGMDGIRETSYSIQLQPQDVIFVYTDGVVEAMDHGGNQFGTDRLLDVLNSEEGNDPIQKVRQVISAIDAFVEGEEQFDDTTMLCIRYNG